MKILIKLVGLRSGGIETLMVNSCEQLLKQGFEFEFMTDKNKTEFYDSKLKRLGIIKYPLDVEDTNKLIRPFIKAIRMYYIIKKGKYDVVHINDSVFHAVISAFVCRLAKVPKIIIHSHTNCKNAKHNLSWHLNWLLRKLASLLATDYVACSKYAAEWSFTDKTLKHDSVRLLKNGIYIKDFSFNKELRKKIRKVMNIGDNEVAVGHVGRYVYPKNQEFILEIAKELKSRGNSNIRFFLVGEGENYNNLVFLINEYNVSDIVNLIPAMYEVGKLYQAFDIFLFPSFYEGLGMAAIEAQTAGLPVLASTGVPDEAKVTDLFYKYDLNDGAEAWATYLIDIVPCIKNRKNMDKYIIEAEYDFNSTVKKLKKIYLGEVE